MEQITIDLFAQVEIKIGEVVAIKVHENADKLIVMQVDIGEEEPRQIVAGIKDFLGDEIDSIVGQRFAFVTNLKPVKLRGVKSNGMILAAAEGRTVLSLLRADCSPGTAIG